jgi:hypothetical protein
MRNLFMNNPNATSEPLDIFMAIEACSPAQLKQQLIKSKQDRDNQQQQQQQIAQEQNEIAKQKMQEDTLWRKEEHYSTLESKEKIAYMQTFSRQDSNMGDSNGDSIADILQFEKLNTDKTNKQELIAIQKQRLELDKQKADNDMKKHKDNVSLQAEKTKMQAIKEKLKLKIAKVNPG